PLREKRPDVPAELAAVIEKAYARDRGHRYQSIAEFVVALAPFAPPRSQTTIDSIARLGGLAAPRAGAAPIQASGSLPVAPTPAIPPPAWVPPPPPVAPVQPQTQHAGAVSAIPVV